jgi:V8-like Glu-specific endopeptidase
MRRCRPLFLTLILSFLASGGAARSAIFDGDDRVRLAPQLGSPYLAIGRAITRNGAGTGFLVSECHMLTAQHIAGPGRASLGSAVTFHLSTTGDRRSRLSSSGRIIATGLFEEAQTGRNGGDGRSRDWMVVRLNKCLGRQVSYVDLDAPVPAPDRSVLRSAGYPSDRPAADALVLDPLCQIHGETKQEVLHDCAALPGNSGSPIFREIVTSSGPRLQLVAMITGGGHWREVLPYHHAYSNRVTSVRYLRPVITAAIAADNSAL